MKLPLLVGTAIFLLAGCANQTEITPLNPAVPYPDSRGPGAIGSPPFQQGSVPTR